MKKLLLGGLVLCLVLVTPRGFLTLDEICTDCGKVRRAEHLWVLSKDWSWDYRSSDLKDTEATRFIRRIGTPAQVHVWRPSRNPYKAGRLLPQEEVLARFDKGIAWDAIRARLRNPNYDTLDPTWYLQARGWPPAVLQEAKAWWAGVPERGGAYSH